MSNFVSAYLKHTQDYESCGAFWKWSAYSAVAAVLRDNVYKQQGDSRMYPSNFVLLFAPTSFHRKNKPVEICERLVNAVANTKVISGRASMQGVLEELSRSETNPTTGAIIKGGSAIFFAPELSSSIVEDPAATKILTDIYDFKPNAFKSILKTQPKFKIDKLVFSMFAASNADMIQSTYDSVAVTGGLLARTLVILPNEFRPGNDLLAVPDKTAEFDCLVKLLTEISTMKGEFVVEDDARKEYHDWYVPFRQEYQHKNEKTGILGRIHTHILKLAMILAVNDYTLVISKYHIEEAMTECLSLLPNYNVFVSAGSRSNIKEAAEIVICELYDAADHKLSGKSLLSKHWRSFDLELLDKVCITLKAGGLITEALEGNEITYQLTKKFFETSGSSKSSSNGARG